MDPKEGIGGKEGMKLFLLVAALGNILGLLLSAGSENGKVYTQGYRLKKEETGAYEQEFLVSVDGEKAGLYMCRYQKRNWKNPKNRRKAES